jgi:hypothetical protein
MTLSADEKRWLMWGALGVLIIVAMWLYSRAQSATPSSIGTVGNPGTDIVIAPQPYFGGTTAGLPDSGLIYYGGQPNAVDTVADLYINENVPGYLSNQYLPLFGLVGFGVGPGIN